MFSTIDVNEKLQNCVDLNKMAELIGLFSTFSE